MPTRNFKIAHVAHVVFLLRGTVGCPFKSPHKHHLHGAFLAPQGALRLPWGAATPQAPGPWLCGTLYDKEVCPAKSFPFHMPGGGGGSGVQTGCPGQSQLLGVEVLKFEIWPRRGSGGKRRGPLLSPGWSCPLCIGWLLVDHFPSHKLM